MYFSLKGNSRQKISMAYMIELLLKSYLVYHSPMFEAWEVPKGQLKCRVMSLSTAVDTRTNSSGMHTHTGQHSRLACMHTLIFA